MNPPQPPPHGDDSYPLNHTQFNSQPISRQSVFGDPFSDQISIPIHEHQPLLNNRPEESYPLYPMQSYPSSIEPSSESNFISTAPLHQPRRYRTTRRVKLTQGHLILDCPVPPEYLSKVPIKEGKEFTHMRYTAATCDPKDFVSERYTLRPQLIGRQTELFIVLTMYNEDEILFARTMHGVMKNISHLCSRDRSKTWGPTGWTKVTVCIVSDGRSKIHPRTLSLLATLGVYQEGVAKNKVNDKPVTAHIYEYTTQISIDPKLKVKGASKGIVPCQIIFCLKENNQKKINSHRWFFQAFSPILQPNVCILIDVGTRPGPTSVYHLWKAFDVRKELGGACGEIRARAGLNPLVAAQHFEYKMSNILDKPLESVMGYITVLPGAFSAYRYRALLGSEGPVEKYFKGEGSSVADLWTANMYLAEDRVLCFELVAKRDARWLLQYVSSAYAETDVPDRMDEFISQRRRWLNGSFFAGVHALWHWRNVWRSNHSNLRKFGFMIENIYLAYTMIFNWFALANFYLTFFILTQALGSDGLDPRPFSAETANLIHLILNHLYVLLIIIQFILALGNRPQGSRMAYGCSMLFFALLMIYMSFATVWITVVSIRSMEFEHIFELLSQSRFVNIVVSLCSTFGLYLLSSLLFLDPWHMITSFLQYLLLSPSYINILNVYAFCNIHDVSWGTKGDNQIATDLGVVQGEATVEVEVPTEEKDLNALYLEAWRVMETPGIVTKTHRDPKTKQEDYYRSLRTRLVLSWIISNLILAVVITNTTTYLGESEKKSTIYLGFVLWSVAILAAIRFIGSILYLILRLF